MRMRKLLQRIFTRVSSERDTDCSSLRSLGMTTNSKSAVRIMLGGDLQDEEGFIGRKATDGEPYFAALRMTAKRVKAKAQYKLRLLDR
jgi:hypothetical protein